MHANPSHLFPLWDFGSPAAAPFGLPMCQNRLAIPTWSYAMERLPPARIIEIGTYSGGFITGLALHAWYIRAKVVSYDVTRPDERVAPAARFLGVDFRQASCWDVESEIGSLIQEPGVTFLLCDGGNKPRELTTFARYLKPGDVIAAHDYASLDGPQANAVYWPCGEITKADAEAPRVAHGLEPWMQDHFDMAAWLVFRKAV